MCCCAKPTINGEPGYSWRPGSESVRRPCFAPLWEGDELIRDFPGRCGGTDSHSFDLRLVRHNGDLVLLVHHGGGQERVKLRAYGERKNIIAGLNDHDGYWLLITLYHVQKDAAYAAKEAEAAKWRKAAVEKRIRVKKVRNQPYCNVSIVPPVREVATNA